MRDTLLLVLACIGGTSVILTACVAMWVAGNACVDWYDRIVKANGEARAERAERESRWAFIVAECDRLNTQRHRPRASWKEGRALYSTVDELIAESSAGARGESDG